MGKRESAREAYDRFAAIYDESNAENDYEMWLGEVLLPELDKHGLQKGWALDVGCGTGRAFDPLLARGWRILGCDVSPAMLAKASYRYGSQVRLLNLDARNLPSICPDPGLPQEEAFDLVLLLNDVLNYMVEDGDLEQVFVGLKRNLKQSHGLAVFDTNTLSLFRRDFASDVAEASDQGWEWRGLTNSNQAGGLYEAHLSGRRVEAHTHRQRHWTVDQVIEALEASDLRCLATLGQREEENRVLLADSPDEERDYKTIYIAG